MNEQQQAHEERLIRRFITEHRAKYEKGTVEHDGCLDEVPLKTLVKFAKDEVLDQWSYVDTIEERLVHAVSLVSQLENSPEKSALLDVLLGDTSAQLDP